MQVDPGPRTQIAAPGDLAGFARNTNAVLLRTLDPSINNEWARSRLIAIASWASGWNVGKTWHYNLWAVRRGGWAGDFYGMAAPEVNSKGELVTVPADKSLWRVYGSFEEAAIDVVKVMAKVHPIGFKILPVEGDAFDFAWVDALHKSGWMTDNTGKSQSVVSARAKKIRGMIAGQVVDTTEEGSSGFGVLIAIGAVLAIAGVLLLVTGLAK